MYVILESDLNLQKSHDLVRTRGKERGRDLKGVDTVNWESGRRMFRGKKLNLKKKRKKKKIGLLSTNPDELEVWEKNLKKREREKRT